MQIYQSGRQTGKTTMLINWLRVNPDGVLVVHSAGERDSVLKQYGGHTLRGDRIMKSEQRVFTIQGVLDGRLRGRHPIVET